MSKGINTQSVLAMRGAGYYSERTAGARDVINDACKMVIEALAQTPKTTVFELQIMVPLMVAPAVKCGIW